MKKIISTISTVITILAGIVFLNSCRQHDEDSLNLPLTQKIQVGNENSKNADTLLQPSNQTEFDEIDYKDPPPKNGGQWKTKK